MLANVLTHTLAPEDLSSSLEQNWEFWRIKKTPRSRLLPRCRKVKIKFNPRPDHRRVLSRNPQLRGKNFIKRSNQTLMILVYCALFWSITVWKLVTAHRVIFRNKIFNDLNFFKLPGMVKILSAKVLSCILLVLKWMIFLYSVLYCLYAHTVK